MKDNKWKAKKLTYGMGWCCALVDSKDAVIKTTDMPYATKSEAKTGQIKTKTGKMITWVRNGNKQTMYCDGQYVGESMVRINPSMQVDYNN